MQPGVHTGADAARLSLPLHRYTSLEASARTPTPLSPLSAAVGAKRQQAGSAGALSAGHRSSRSADVPYYYYADGASAFVAELEANPALVHCQQQVLQLMQGPEKVEAGGGRPAHRNTVDRTELANRIDSLADERPAPLMPVLFADMFEMELLPYSLSGHYLKIMHSVPEAAVLERLVDFWHVFHKHIAIDVQSALYPLQQHVADFDCATLMHVAFVRHVVAPVCEQRRDTSPAAAGTQLSASLVRMFNSLLVQLNGERGAPVYRRLASAAANTAAAMRTTASIARVAAENDDWDTVVEDRGRTKRRSAAMLRDLPGGGGGGMALAAADGSVASLRHIVEPVHALGRARIDP